MEAESGFDAGAGVLDVRDDAVQETPESERRRRQDKTAAERIDDRGEGFRVKFRVARGPG